MRSAANTGNLPLVCDTISAVSVGSLAARDKLQTPLDSYQEDDLTRECKNKKKSYFGGFQDKRTLG